MTIAPSNSRNNGETVPASGPPTIVKPSINMSDLQFPQWDAMLRRIVCTDMYQFQLFIQDSSEVAINSPIYKEVKRAMNLTTAERNFIQWWQVSGKKVYAKALSQKRQTLSNTLKCLVIENIMDHDRENPPPLPGSIYEKNEDGTITGIRENQDLYSKFLKTYGKAVYGRNFELDSQTKTLSTFFPTCIEAFLILAYENGYAMWKREARKREEKINSNHRTGQDASERGTTDDEQDNDTVSFKFTSNARGSKRAEGWSEDGLTLFDDLFETIEKQQNDDNQTGLPFEANFMTFGQDETNTNANGRTRRPLRNNWGDRARYRVATTGLQPQVVYQA